MKESVPYAIHGIAHVADLIEKSQFPDSPQQMESGIGFEGMRVARMNCITSSFKSSLSFIMSHRFVSNIKSDAKREVSIERGIFNF